VQQHFNNLRKIAFLTAQEQFLVLFLFFSKYLILIVLDQENFYEILISFGINFITKLI